MEEISNTLLIINNNFTKAKSILDKIFASYDPLSYSERTYSFKTAQEFIDKQNNVFLENFRKQEEFIDLKSVKKSLLSEQSNTTLSKSSGQKDREIINSSLNTIEFLKIINSMLNEDFSADQKKTLLLLRQELMDKQNEILRCSFDNYNSSNTSYRSFLNEKENKSKNIFSMNNTINLAYDIAKIFSQSTKLNNNDHFKSINSISNLNSSFFDSNKAKRDSNTPKKIPEFSKFSKNSSSHNCFTTNIGKNNLGHRSLLPVTNIKNVNNLSVILNNVNTHHKIYSLLKNMVSDEETFVSEREHGNTNNKERLLCKKRQSSNLMTSGSLNLDTQNFNTVKTISSNTIDLKELNSINLNEEQEKKKNTRDKPRFNTRIDCLRKRVKNFFHIYLLDQLNLFTQHDSEIFFNKIPKKLQVNVNTAFNKELFSKTVYDFLCTQPKKTDKQDSPQDATEKDEKVDHNIKMLHLIENKLISMNKDNNTNINYLIKLKNFLSLKTKEVYLNWLSSEKFDFDIKFLRHKESKEYIEKFIEAAKSFLLCIMNNDEDDEEKVLHNE